MAELNDRIQKILKEHLQHPNEARFLLAVSGGLDSITLVDIMHQMGLTFEIAHCNFQLRDNDSDLDELLVTELAERLSLSCHVKQFDVKSHAKSKGISTQMAARELRYEWFQELMIEGEIDFLCTAHHLNDSIETSLFNLSKGTGLKGLTGIAKSREGILRPLLTISKTELLNYARHRNLTWREDQSNHSPAYMRTIIRNEIIPSMQKINPSFIETSLRTLDRLAGSQKLLDRYIGLLLTANLRKKNNAELLSLDAFSTFSAEEKVVCLLAWLTPFGFNLDQVKDIEVHSNQSGKRFLANGYELLVDRHRLILSPMAGTIVNIEVLSTDVQISINDRTYSLVKISSTNWKVSRDSGYLQLDYEKLQFPLTIRTWQEGDWFVPLGMKGKKKISDFMIDRKIPVNFKREVLILVSGENIAGILGYQVDDRYKVNEETKEILIVKEI